MNSDPLDDVQRFMGGWSHEDFSECPSGEQIIKIEGFPDGTLIAYTKTKKYVVRDDVDGFLAWALLDQFESGSS